MEIKRGELYYANLSPVMGSEQGGLRPVLVVQNDIGNKYSPTVIVAAVTSSLTKAKLPTHIPITCATYTGLTKNSVILLEQLRTIDKMRLQQKIGQLDNTTMAQVDKAMLLSLGYFT
ncbi:MAG: type II toxin-antitoxin system PemK/MazF family toxin [Clostridia bacterium]|nr:type II toxin-antitoxin system PemK/MazF family toxin [Clostridia bacterium]